jgi:uncharacterized protein YbjT (DUF2867 family)
MQSPILVTGASGNVGGEIVKLLAQQGAYVRAARRPGNARNLTSSATVEFVDLDFAQPATFAAAFNGVKRMFLMRPPALSNVRRYIVPAIDAAVAAGVEHIVFLSLIGVESNRLVPHYKIEQHVLQVGVPYTFLRPSFFMQNLNTTHRQEIKERNELFIPAGKGQTSFIDVRDIAAVAVKALTEPDHTNQAYALTGSEAIDYSQVAAQLSRVLARPIVYRQPALWQFMLRQRSLGTAWPFILVMAGIYTTARLGLAGRLTDDTHRLLGREPIRLQQYIEDYQQYWLL